MKNPMKDPIKLFILGIVTFLILLMLIVVCFPSHLFWVGLSMIVYDFLGHFFCAIARLTGNVGASVWNKYSRFVWPTVVNELLYDMGWAIWFFVAISFILIGHLDWSF